MSAVPKEPAVQTPERRRRPVLVAARAVPPRRRAVAAAAVAAYAAAAAALVLAVLPALEGREREGSGIRATAPEPALALAPRELLAMRALAARAQPAVYEIQAGSGRGTGFVAWTQPARNRTFLLTARAIVAGLLAEGGRTVFVSRGGRFWTGRLWAADRVSGLAVIRVDTVLRRPLWQDDDEPGALDAGARAFVVPPTRDTAFGEGTVGPAGKGRFALRVAYDALYLGAPVVNSDGRAAGVVIAADPRGRATVAPLAAACERLRRCSSD